MSVRLMNNISIICILLGCYLMYLTLSNQNRNIHVSHEKLILEEVLKDLDKEYHKLIQDSSSFITVLTTKGNIKVKKSDKIVSLIKKRNHKREELNNIIAGNEVIEENISIINSYDRELMDVIIIETNKVSKINEYTSNSVGSNQTYNEAKISSLKTKIDSLKRKPPELKITKFTTTDNYGADHYIYENVKYIQIILFISCLKGVDTLYISVQDPSGKYLSYETYSKFKLSKRKSQVVTFTLIR